MKKWILLAVLAIAAAAGGVMFYRSKPAEASNTLITAPITRGNVVETVQSTGTLEAVTTVQVGTQVSGAIKALHADFNSQVRAGQVVAELEPSLFETQVEQQRATLVRVQADLDRARVQLEDAQIKLKRATELSARGLIPQTELETAQSNARQAQSALKSAEAQIVQARASLNQAQVNLDNTVIKAPIDGVVVSRNVDVGQTVAASMQAPVLFVIAKDMTQMQVSASIDESDIGRIQPGQTVTFRVDAYPDDAFTGTVKQVRLQPVVTQNVVSYTTIISVPNPSLRLKPGMTANVTVEIARADNVLRVPTGALRFRPTAEVFASLNQEPPQGLDGPGGGRGPGAEGLRAGGPGATPPSAAPGTAAPGTTSAPGTRAPGTTPTPSTPAPDTADPAADGPGGRRGGGAFADMTPEQRQQMRERMQNMSPDERAQMRGQVGGGEGGRRGGRRGGLAQGGEGGGAQAGARGQGQRGGGRGDGAAAGANARPADAPRPVIRPVWLLKDGKLERVMLRIGINDGAMTAVLDGPVQPGAVVATGVAQAQSAQQGGNPLLGRGFPGAGGFGGGGFGGGGRPGGNRGGGGGGR